MLTAALIAVLAAILTPLLQGLRSDHRGYMASLEKWKEAYKANPFAAGDKPRWDWDLFRGRMIDAGYAALILLVAFSLSNTSNVNVDRATVEAIVRDMPATQPGGAQ